MESEVVQEYLEGQKCSPTHYPPLPYHPNLLQEEGGSNKSNLIEPLNHLGSYLWLPYGKKIGYLLMPELNDPSLSGIYLKSF